ncbi:MAG TPA: nucleotidyltransferase [Candidatus Hydrogenedentes bacterium]|nr:nucleotidyltransferase [Candidatus Hydrogenedentota bacterium]
MITRELLAEKREAILKAARRRGARSVRVFGSVARGDANETSDVDFVVCFEPGRSLFDHGGLVMDLRDLLGESVDVVDEADMRPAIKEQALKDAMPL